MLKGVVLRKTENANDWFKVFFEDKPEKQNIIIETVIELKKTGFDSLYHNFLKDRIFITENSKYMWKDEEGWHMLAITCKERDKVICIDSESYDFARYVSIFYKQDFEWIYTRRCNCTDCNKKADCTHKDAYRRMPKEIGGLALCPKLKDNTDPVWRKDDE